MSGRFGPNKLLGRFVRNKLSGRFGRNKLSGRFGRNKLSGRFVCSMLSGRFVSKLSGRFWKLLATKTVKLSQIAQGYQLSFWKLIKTTVTS